MNYEVIVIGSGVIGLSTAYELALRGRFVAVIEKEQEFAFHSSRRNSGIIHDGFNRKPGTLKAELCVRGAALLRDRCEKWNVPRRVTGSLVVGEEKGARQLLSWGKQNGVKGLELVHPQSREPEVSGEVALFSPAGTVIDPSAYMRSLYNECIRNMVQFHLGQTVIGLEPGWTVRTRSFKGREWEFKTSSVVNAAGVHSDTVASMAGIRRYTIVPYRGEYARVEGAPSIRHQVYPLPPGDGFSLGIHLTPRVDGSLLIGPSTVRVNDKEDYESNRTKAEELRNEAARLVPSLASEKVSLSYSGIRAHLDDGDFVIERHAPGLVNCIGIESPGLTSSIAIAEKVMGLLDAARVRA